ncbi:Amino Acid-Polyamine-Organocation (APC) Family [Thraustotheca clavata]|uniref:Amino Acid-Polyamine-Organocation (APC) Family n=1 Tax=Thraustotheca clavata TaxID=74557 RepID=A0A1V9ZDH2_9STRA|nr:Amino Acid-Polyamine-Organocation (APC) Family [Thraustotheca clavata]
MQQRRKGRCEPVDSSRMQESSASNTASKAWLRLSWRKPLSLTYAQEQSAEHPHMERTLGCFDLLMIGIGGTVGSGVFATAGLIARSYAGPGAVLSWLLAGLGCILSGASFMELSCMIPSAGSTYAYAYHSLGELPAMIAGMLLTLEYGVSSAGGARSWSDKLVAWLAHIGIPGPEWMKPKDSSIDLYAGLLMSICVAIVLCGMSAGKRLINTITVIKISVVLFIIVVGLSQFHKSNLQPFLPPSYRNEQDQVVYGWSGVMLGASASFYGYIGYDEVCCLAAEAKNPTRDIPRAVFGTVIGAAFLSTMATLSLLGMQKYSAIDIGESYGTAFHQLGMSWASSIVETGEVFTMPVGILIGFLAQPRVQFAMARDGLVPGIFSKLDKHGNPFYGTLICGIALIIVAVFIPFKYLWDFISLGILIAFNITNTCLLTVRYRNSNVVRPIASIVPDNYQVFTLIFAFLSLSYLSAYHIQESILAPRAPAEDSQHVSWRHWYMEHYGVQGAFLFSILSSNLASCALRNICLVVLVIMLKMSTPKPDPTSKASPINIQANMPDTPSTVVSTDADTDSHITFNDEDNTTEDDEEKKHPTASGFQAPFVPFFPCLAIWFNWFLAIQIPSSIVLLMGLYMCIACGFYVYYGLGGQHSLASQHTNRYSSVSEAP